MTTRDEAMAELGRLDKRLKTLRERKAQAALAGDAFRSDGPDARKAWDKSIALTVEVQALEAERARVFEVMKSLPYVPSAGDLRRAGFTEDRGVNLDEEEVADELLGMGIGQVQRYGPVKVFRSDRDTWLVAAAGMGKEFSIPRFAARWVVAMTEE